MAKNPAQTLRFFGWNTYAQRKGLGVVPKTRFFGQFHGVTSRREWPNFTPSVTASPFLVSRRIAFVLFDLRYGTSERGLEFDTIGHGLDEITGFWLGSPSRSECQPEWDTTGLLLILIPGKKRSPARTSLSQLSYLLDGQVNGIPGDRRHGSGQFSFPSPLIELSKCAHVCNVRAGPWSVPGKSKRVVKVARGM